MSADPLHRPVHDPAGALLGEVRSTGWRYQWRCAACGTSSPLQAGPRRVSVYLHQGTAARRLQEHAMWCRARLGVSA